MGFHGTGNCLPSVCQFDIYTMNAEGTARVAVTSDPGYDTEPTWSPDGTRIAFVCESDICTIGPNGLGRSVLVDAPEDGVSNLWRPDWQRLPRGYPRPKGASPIQVSLVPAFRPCTLPTATHGRPLSWPSCRPPAQVSDLLTVGAPDANGKPAASSGSIKLMTVGESPIDVDNGDQADVAITATLTDVRTKNDFSDYAGELQGVATLRITDRNNGPAFDHPATVVDVPLGFTIPCSATAGTEGGAFSLSTTSDAVIPGVAREGKRAMWELDQIKVFDGGPDGDADTADNTLFAVQGIFVP